MTDQPLPVLYFTRMDHLDSTDRSLLTLWFNDTGKLTVTYVSHLGFLALRHNLSAPYSTNDRNQALVPFISKHHSGIAPWRIIVKVLELTIHIQLGTKIATNTSILFHSPELSAKWTPVSWLPYFNLKIPGTLSLSAQHLAFFFENCWTS